MMKYLLAIGIGLSVAVNFSSRANDGQNKALNNLEASQAEYTLLDSLERRLSDHQTSDTLQLDLLIALSYQYQWQNFYRSLHYAEKAWTLAEQLHDQKGIATAAYRQAHCFWAFGDNDRSIEKALTAIAIAEENHYPTVLAESFQMLARNYMDQREQQKAEQYINRAEVLSLQLGDWDLLSRVYNLAGVIQFLNDNNDSAFVLYTKAMHVVQNHKTEKFQLSQITSNIGEYYALHDPDRGLHYFYEALSHATETRNRSAEAGISSSLARVLTEKGRYQEAEQYLQAALRLSRELGLKRVIRHAYYALADLKVREGDASEALGYMKKYYDVRDSILNSAKTRQIVELENRYEADKKEQEIKFLKQEKKIASLWKNVLIIGTLLLLVVLLVIYRLQRQRNRKAKQLLCIQQELNTRLKETDQLKSRFFANISHEFRTPLSLILAPLEANINSTATSFSKDDLRIVKRNANRLLDLVNQLLDLSKLEAKKMELQLRDGDLRAFLQVLVASFDSLAEHQGIHFSKQILVRPTPIPFDADKLEKIISNVLFNAFKFTLSGGSVTLSIHDTRDGHTLAIKITDTGIGIPEEEQPHIFSPFYQSKNTSDNGQLGTGLGLALVSELVKLHEGSITLTSQYTIGTTLAISLPIRAVEVDSSVIGKEQTLVVAKTIVPEFFADEPPTASDTAYEDTILVVEDNPDLRNFIASGFRRRYRVLTATHGVEGLAAAVEHVPTLIISDVMMPQMDGLELTDKVKSDARTCHIPIILLTAKAELNARIEGYNAGADDYLAKPFSVQELRIRAENLISLRKNLAAQFRDEIAARPVPGHQVNADILTLDERFIRKARAIVENHIGDVRFGVEKLADEMHLSRTQLFRKFKALIGTSPSDFISDIRLQRAAEMIRSRSDTLAQISYAVGFNEQSYFSKRFRKKFGVTPGSYAESITSPK